MDWEKTGTWSRVHATKTRCSLLLCALRQVSLPGAQLSMALFVEDGVHGKLRSPQVCHSCIKVALWRRLASRLQAQMISCRPKHRNSGPDGHWLPPPASAGGARDAPQTSRHPLGPTPRLAQVPVSYEAWIPARCHTIRKSKIAMACYGTTPVCFSLRGLLQGCRWRHTPASQCLESLKA